MTACDSQLSVDFYQRRPLMVKFSELELSSDVGLLLARQAEERLQICQTMSDAMEDWRAPSRVIHSLPQLFRQRVLQILAGYEDANDSDALRHDPIFKIACDRLPIPGEELASQPTISRLENQVSARDNAAMRRVFVELFIASYPEAPSQVTLDVDGWDDPTHGAQEASQGKRILKPVKHE